MALFGRLQEEMKASLKGGDAEKLSVVRMLIAEIKTYCIDKALKEAADADVIRIVQRHIKQRKESIAQFEKGGRADLAAKEAAELKILEGYMPKQLSEAELLKAVEDAVRESGAVTKADIGKAMKLAMEKTAGRADGKAINQLILGLLK